MNIPCIYIVSGSFLIYSAQFALRMFPFTPYCNEQRQKKKVQSHDKLAGSKEETHTPVTAGDA